MSVCFEFFGAIVKVVKRLEKWYDKVKREVMKWTKVGSGLIVFFVNKRYERFCWNYEGAYFVYAFYELLRNYEVSRNSTIKYQILLIVIFFSSET